MYKFKHPFTCIVSGPSGAGKTVFCVDLINQLCKDFNEIVWCYSENLAIPDSLKDRVIFNKGLPKEGFNNVSGKPKLYIIDDLLESYGSNQVTDVFTKQSHHRNISLVLITQNLFHQNKHSRDISLNAKYIVAFKNPRDKTQIRYLIRQICPENSKGLEEAYLEATSKPHGYLLFDLCQDTPDLLRFRTNLFNTFTTVYVGKDEKDKIELSLPESA